MTGRIRIDGALCDGCGKCASACGEAAQFPVKLSLVSPDAGFLKGSRVLLCADCVPFVVKDFHARFRTGHAVLSCCPKLDDMERSLERLSAIIAKADPAGIAVLRMAVPCCSALAGIALEAASGRRPVDLLVADVAGAVGRDGKDDG
jgi:Fe-S-cluster-containing dehydrogenase component